MDSLIWVRARISTCHLSAKLTSDHSHFIAEWINFYGFVVGFQQGNAIEDGRHCEVIEVKASHSVSHSISRHWNALSAVQALGSGRRVALIISWKSGVRGSHWYHLIHFRDIQARCQSTAKPPIHRQNRDSYQTSREKTKNSLKSKMSAHGIRHWHHRSITSFSYCAHSSVIVSGIVPQLSILICRLASCRHENVRQVFCHIQFRMYSRHHHK